jgi:hypothetical protein
MTADGEGLNKGTVPVRDCAPNPDNIAAQKHPVPCEVEEIVSAVRRLEVRADSVVDGQHLFRFEPGARWNCRYCI